MPKIKVLLGKYPIIKLCKLTGYVLVFSVQNVDTIFLVPEINLNFRWQIMNYIIIT